MERLTIPDKKVGGGWKRTVIDPEEVKKYAMTIYWGLKKYEDTGLTPDEINALRERDDSGGWIPVEERLPEDEEMVLVTCQTKSGRRSINKAWYGDGFWHGTGSMSGVIAWHPLPEPYRPEQEAAQRPEWQERMLHTFLGGHA